MHLGSQKHVVLYNFACYIFLWIIYWVSTSHFSSFLICISKTLVYVLHFCLGSSFTCTHALTEGKCAQNVYYLYFWQVKGDHLIGPCKRQQLVRSILSQSEKSISRGCESIGGSGSIAPFPKPYMLCFAIDAMSATFDYSKGDIKDNIINNPPSLRPTRISICSSLPLK